MIQINFLTADQIATRMGNASDAIQQATSNTISKDERTTLTVNQKAQKTNQQALELAQQFNQAFQQTVQNIQLALKEFERTDIELQNNFEPLLPINDAVEDMNTYNKAKNG
ncbi:TIGR04197 family type VII secretion effector [Virgibacillus sp. FSP13]